MKCLLLLGSLVASLLFNVYAQSLSEDASAFQEGTAPKFSIKGHPKSKGAVFTFKYPPSWRALEGDRPNVVQKFVSESGRGLEMAMILTKSIPPQQRFTKADVHATVSPEGLKEFLPSGARLLGVETTKIEGEPAGLVEYSTRAGRSGIEIDGRTLTLIFLQGRTIVSVQFSVAVVASDSADLPRRFEKFRPLFNMMINSIVFNDKWK